VPDPAFKFTTPRRTIRAFDDWFRGNQPNVRYWERQANAKSGNPLREPSALARRARRAADELGAEVLDVGAGRGADSLWLARKGLRVTAYDYVPRALKEAEARARKKELALEVRHLNLTEWRSVYAEGARLAWSPRPRVVLARHVLDATSRAGRESLARLCSMALREGGRLLADFHVGPTAPDWDWVLAPADVESVTTLLTHAGASRVDVEQLPGRDRVTMRLEAGW
jgi:SAM-dependent methyltransferase